MQMLTRNARQHVTNKYSHMYFHPRLIGPVFGIETIDFSLSEDRTQINHPHSLPHLPTPLNNGGQHQVAQFRDQSQVIVQLCLNACNILTTILRFFPSRQPDIQMVKQFAII